MFDTNNQYSGAYFGKDRLGHTTPDPDGTEILRPFLIKPYPACWLPGRRRDEGHPVGAQVVVSAGYLLGKDKSGYLVPAGLKSGNTGNGGDYVAVVYGQDDVNTAFNPQSGNLVSAAGEAVLIAAPADYAQAITVTGTATINTAALTVAGTDKAKIYVGSYISIVGVTGVKRVIARTGDVCTLDSNVNAAAAGAVVSYGTPTIAGFTPGASDVTFAQACNLIPAGSARPVGYALRNVFQYLGAVTIKSTTNGISYGQDGMTVAKYRMHNYMHEPGTAVQTSMGLRVPYIGDNLNSLNAIAAANSLTAQQYQLDDYSRSFVHCVGSLDLSTGTSGKLFDGCALVADDQNGVIGSGHYRPFDPNKHTADQVIGRVLGIEAIYPINDYADRVRTQFDRAQSFGGPFADSHPVTQMMGGSATKGLDYSVNLSTKGLLRKLLEKGVAPASIPAECATYIWMGIRTL